jgi:hypothetical protein
MMLSIEQGSKKTMKGNEVRVIFSEDVPMEIVVRHLAMAIKQIAASEESNLARMAIAETIVRIGHEIAKQMGFKIKLESEQLNPAGEKN